MPEEQADDKTTSPESEREFFDKPEKEHTGGTGLFKPYKPPSTAAKVALVVTGLAVFGAILFFTNQKDEATLWVMNPGPDKVQLQVGNDSHDLEPGKLLDAKVEVEDGFELGAFRGDHAEDIKVELVADSEAVTLVDLGADAAYIVLDVSPIYTAETPPKSLQVMHTAQPGKVHRLPFPALKLVRPGNAIPEKGSWELKAAQGASTTIEIFKVFRVDPRRLADQAKLAEVLTEGVLSKATGDYENMRTFVDMKQVDSHEGVIPKIK
jgi:hypothetical protein